MFSKLYSWEENGKEFGLYLSDRTVSGRMYFVSANPAIMKDWLTDDEARELADLHPDGFNKGLMKLPVCLPPRPVTSY